MTTPDVTISSGGSSSKARKDRIYRILEGELVPEFNVEAASAIRKLVESDAVPVEHLSPRWDRCFLLCATLFVVLLFAKDRIPFEVLEIGVTLVALSFAQTVIYFLRENSRLNTEMQRVTGPLSELEGTQARLQAYLDQLDQRTRKYFHCVTSTKVVSYCVLRQIMSALNERLSELRVLLQSRQAGKIVKAEEIFKRPLLFRDGFLQNTGKEYSLALDKLSPVVGQLIEDLDKSLTELEDEIRIP